MDVCMSNLGVTGSNGWLHGLVPANNPSLSTYGDMDYFVGPQGLDIANPYSASNEARFVFTDYKAYCKLFNHHNGLLHYKAYWCKYRNGESSASHIPSVKQIGTDIGTPYSTNLPRPYESIFTVKSFVSNVKVLSVRKGVVDPGKSVSFTVRPNIRLNKVYKVNKFTGDDVATNFSRFLLVQFYGPQAYSDAGAGIGYVAAPVQIQYFTQISGKSVTFGQSKTTTFDGLALNPTIIDPQNINNPGVYA